MKSKFVAMALLAMALVPAMLFGIGNRAARAERIWWDGSRDNETTPPGKLLSDNPGYWGETVFTGVDYRYEAAPDNPADSGRRLLDGVPAGDWNVPVGMAAKPIVAVFDFKRICTFSEIDLSTRSQKAAFKIEVSEQADGGWRGVYDQTREAAPDKMFHRLPLPAKPSGRYLRLTVNAVAPALNQWLTYLEEVVVWGDATVSAQAPEAIAPVGPTPNITGASIDSIPGARQSTFADIEFRRWQTSLGARAKSRAVWAAAPTWDSLTNQPILPPLARINQPVALVMARNEAEYAALTLTNTNLDNPLTDEVKLGAFEKVGGQKLSPAAMKVRGQLRVAGVMASREFGVNAVPLLASDNMPGASLMRRYLTNGAAIQNFPRLTLSPAGSAILWLQVTTEGAAPGLYRARLSFGARDAMNVQVEVVDVTLPKPFVWLQTWSGGTSMFPFMYGDRTAREVAYKQSLGVTVWNELPTPGSPSEEARKHGRTFHQIFVLPFHYVNDGYNGRLKAADLTAKDEAEIAQNVHQLVKQTQALGLTYDDWSGELWDEPGRGSIEAFGALAALVKKADPKVNLYANPIFWEGNGVADDAAIYAALSPWYAKLVDISVQHDLLLRPKSLPLFDEKRLVRGAYAVSTRSAKSERAVQVEFGRRQAWDAFSRGWNGWGFYSYFAPRGNPWDDFDTGEPDYQMVYPGPRGPIPTRESEAVRQGWEDFCLLSLLQQRGLKAPLTAILDAYRKGEAMPTLRLRALRAAATSSTRAPGK